jgi:hypothetical protein
VGFYAGDLQRIFVPSASPGYGEMGGL